MSQTTNLRALDALIMSKLAAAGMADSATYTAPLGSPVSCTVVVDRSVQSTGFDSQVDANTVLITAQLAEVTPAKGGVFTVGAETFKVDKVQDRDESRAECVCKVGA